MLCAKTKWEPKTQKHTIDETRQNKTWLKVYSWVRLIRPYTEKLISWLFVGEKQFWLVLQDHKHRECYRLLVFFPSGATFFLPYTGTLLPLLSGHFKWIFAEAGHMDLSEKQIHVTCFTNPFEMPTEQRKQCACVGQKKVAPGGKTSSLQPSLCLYGSGALIRIDFHPQTAEKMAPPCIARLDLVNCRYINVHIFSNRGPHNLWGEKTTS